MKRAFCIFRSLRIPLSPIKERVGDSQFSEVSYMQPKPGMHRILLTHSLVSAQRTFALETETPRCSNTPLAKLHTHCFSCSWPALLTGLSHQIQVRLLTHPQRPPTLLPQPQLVLLEAIRSQ